MTEAASAKPDSYVRPERLWIKSCSDLNERWVQNLIETDPSILGLGDLSLRSRERKQPKAGRLDLLLEDTNSEPGRRYTVEIQLGPTDESHIIRTIEYWDIERKRYPQYDHCAVIVAEDITSRFLNVISLFNGTMPLIAIQMQALKIGKHTTLVFTKVLDELKRGLVDEDEEVQEIATDREFWESTATKNTVSLADELLVMVNKVAPNLQLKYNKQYIGLVKDGTALNFVAFVPKKNHIILRVKLPKTEYIDSKIDEAGLEKLQFNNFFNYYQIRLTRDEIGKKAEVLQELMELAYKNRMG